MKTDRPSIFEYNDFRKFIADYQQARQKQDASFSKSQMSRLLGLPNTRSYMTDVLREKVVTPAFVERFVKLFQFSQDEANYFRILIKFNQADNPDERELFFEQLITLNKTPKRHLYKQAYLYYKDWYNGALRALLNVCDFNGRDFSALARQLVPQISVPMVKKSFALLLKMGLIAKNAKGFYKPTEQSISTEDYVRDEILKQFQLKCLDLAKSAVVTDLKQPRIIATNTISVSQPSLKRIEKQIQRFRSQIRSLVHKDEYPAETVYQMDVLFFPMMKRE
jgi:uncharacterized protein (TIGR02147 family)